MKTEFRMFPLRTAFLMPALIPLYFIGTQDNNAQRNSWTGFEKGSWVIVQETKSLNGKSVQTKHKELLVEFRGAAPLLAHIPEMEGRFGPPGKTHEIHGG